METLELPVVEEREDTVAAPVNFLEQEIDVAAFGLWRDASSLMRRDDEDATGERAQSTSA
jgi:hypothetical protein